MGGQLNTPPVNAGDYQALAQERLDANAWAYFAGGAGDEITLRDNRAAWEALRLLPRIGTSLAGADTSVELLGRRWPTPLLLAPVAYLRMAHPDGERAAALAAAAQGCGLVLSSQASTRLEDVAALVRDEAGRGPLWFQLYRQRDAGLTRELITRAHTAGFEALVLTVDAPVSGARDRERRAGFRLPPGVSAVNLPPPSAGGGTLLQQAAEHVLDWAAIEALAAASPLPLLLKGVLHPDDARRALSCGVAGLVVSNHGGRTLDTTVSTAWALPRIADAVGGALPLLVDGGIRRGTDVVKALALGATAVLLGRPQVWALATAGAPGVAHLLRLLRDELEIALALCGCPGSARIGRGLIAGG
ncbi:alpha-hydroxy acid oxidase [Rubrivivax gelatinosus]|uniref:FMN-dependent alpha-hydroxy acid dehydrogenase n=1 Tax=Rubrivivax gelatinosus (strain NBRC 100245 / IL144) TaxID=983917 RepID=I0HXJ0_RUBGI|nr:alpha-hydroxy acid oxidase [Rubrivivax gelatinosus]MBG6079659.1 4-hydroxymandelate oxidase [Rubrivivax gelatinosus]BAL97727.1 FMN-dependent alpha-hydroxy acid dehydrogenase [Rubrivivax gelatinosus IL144]